MTEKIRKFHPKGEELGKIVFKPEDDIKAVESE